MAGDGVTMMEDLHAREGDTARDTETGLYRVPGVNKGGEYLLNVSQDMGLLIENTILSVQNKERS